MPAHAMPREERDGFDARLDPDALRVTVQRLDAMIEAEWAEVAARFNRHGAVVLSGRDRAPRRDELLALAPTFVTMTATGRSGPTRGQRCRCRRNTAMDIVNTGSPGDRGKGAG